MPTQLSKTLLEQRAKIKTIDPNEPEQKHLDVLAKIIELSHSPKIPNNRPIEDDELNLYIADPILAKRYLSVLEELAGIKNKPTSEKKAEQKDQEEKIQEILFDKTDPKEFDPELLEQIKKVQLEKMFKPIEAKTEEEKMTAIENRIMALEHDPKEREKVQSNTSHLVSVLESIQARVKKKINMTSETAPIYDYLEEVFTNYVRSGKLPKQLEFPKTSAKKQNNAMPRRGAEDEITRVETPASRQRTTTTNQFEDVSLDELNSIQISTSAQAARFSSATSPRVVLVDDDEQASIFDRFRTKYADEYGRYILERGTEIRPGEEQQDDPLGKWIKQSRLGKIPYLGKFVYGIYWLFRLISRAVVHLGVVSGIYLLLVGLTTAARDAMTYGVSALVATAKSPAAAELAANSAVVTAKAAGGLSGGLIAASVILFIVYGVVLLGTTVYFCIKLYKKHKAGTATKYNWIGTIGLCLIMLSSLIVTACLLIPSLVTGTVASGLTIGLGTMISFICLTICYILPRGFLQFFVIRYKSLSERISHKGSIVSAILYGLEQIPVGFAMFFAGPDLLKIGIQGTVGQAATAGEVALTGGNAVVDPIANTSVIVARGAANAAGEAADELLQGNFLVSAGTWKRFVFNVKFAFKRLGRSVPVSERASFIAKVGAVLNWKEMVSDHVEVIGGIHQAKEGERGKKAKENALKALDRSAIRVAAYSAIFGVGMPILAALGGLAGGIIWASIWIGVMIGLATYFIYGYLHEKISLVDVTENTNLSPGNVIRSLKQKITSGLMSKKTVAQNASIYQQMLRSEEVERRLIQELLNLEPAEVPIAIQDDLLAIRVKQNDQALKDKLLMNILLLDDLSDFNDEVRRLVHSLEHIHNVDELERRIINLFKAENQNQNQAPVAVPRTLVNAWAKLNQESNNKTLSNEFISGLLSLSDREIPDSGLLRNLIRQRKTIARTPEQLASEFDEENEELAMQHALSNRRNGRTTEDTDETQTQSERF